MENNQNNNADDANRYKNNGNNENSCNGCGGNNYNGNVNDGCGGNNYNGNVNDGCGGNNYNGNVNDGCGGNNYNGNVNDGCGGSNYNGNVNDGCGGNNYNGNVNDGCGGNNYNGNVNNGCNCNNYNCCGGYENIDGTVNSMAYSAKNNVGQPSNQCINNYARTDYSKYRYYKTEGDIYADFRMKNFENVVSAKNKEIDLAEDLPKTKSPIYIEKHKTKKQKKDKKNILDNIKPTDIDEISKIKGNATDYQMVNFPQKNKNILSYNTDSNQDNNKSNINQQNNDSDVNSNQYNTNSDANINQNNISSDVNINQNNITREVNINQINNCNDIESNQFDFYNKENNQNNTNYKIENNQNNCDDTDKNDDRAKNIQNEHNQNNCNNDRYDRIKNANNKTENYYDLDINYSSKDEQDYLKTKRYRENNDIENKILDDDRSKISKKYDYLKENIYTKKNQFSYKDNYDSRNDINNQNNIGRYSGKNYDNKNYHSNNSARYNADRNRNYQNDNDVRYNTDRNRNYQCENGGYNADCNLNNQRENNICYGADCSRNYERNVNKDDSCRDYYKPNRPNYRENNYKNCTNTNTENNKEYFANCQNENNYHNDNDYQNGKYKKRPKKDKAKNKRKIKSGGLLVGFVLLASFIVTFCLCNFFIPNSWYDSAINNDIVYFAVGKCAVGVDDYKSIRDSFINRGAGGYVHTEGNQILVIADIYENKEDAESVLNNVNNKNAFDTIKEFRLKEYNYTKVDKNLVMATTSALNYIDIAFYKLKNIATSLSSKDIDEVEAKSRVAKLANEIYNIKQFYDDTTFGSANEKVLKLKAQLGVVYKYFTDLKNEINMPSAIRNTYITILLLHIDLVNDSYI